MSARGMLRRKLHTANTILAERGVTELVKVAAEKIPFSRRRRLHMIVSPDEARAVDWTAPAHFANPAPVPEGPIKTAWIISTPGKSSGGHQNIFRFISYLEKAGHSVTVYLYSERSTEYDAELARQLIKESPSYSRTHAELRLYDPATGVDADTQAIFATGWETAYPAYLDPNPCQRFYFVQDYEPSFYPIGTDAQLATNTYSFGFHGITAGRWLAEKLHGEFGMSTDYYEFSVDTKNYRFTNPGKRNEVFFYARPVTPRRGFELGALALAELYRMRPDITINLAGWDVSNYDLPFEYVNHKDVEVGDLSDIYNRCAAGFVLSLTNLSLLPMELIACGVVPVVNTGPNNELVGTHPAIEYVETSPRAIARRIIEVVDREDGPAQAAQMAQSVGGQSWDGSGEQFIAAFERTMRGQ